MNPVAANSDKIAMVVRHAQIDGEKSEYLNQIWLSDTKINNIRQFTYHEKSSTHPRFSPNGEFLAFLSSRPIKQQIWVMRTSGGEAWQFSHEKQGVGSFKWSPSGDKIAFLMNDQKYFIISFFSHFDHCFNRDKFTTYVKNAY